MAFLRLAGVDISAILSVFLWNLRHVSQMSDLSTAVDLLVAVIDLKVVKSIRNAVRVNTLKKGGVEGPLGNIENPKPVHGSFGVIVEPRYEQRRVFHPEPTYEARIVHHRTVERPAIADLKQPLLPEQMAPPAIQKSPLVPPWQMPLPIVAVPTIKVVKYEAPQPDQICKGMLVDQFI